MKTAESYIAGIERRHNMSAEARSKGEHIHGMPDVTECGTGGCKISGGDAPGGRKGGRSSGSNKGPNPGKGEGSADYQ
jgi:hypothetical protein